MSGDIRDDFADIIAKNKGLFSSENATLDDALGNLDSVESAVMPEGVGFELTCHGCRRTQRYTVEYPEMVALKFRVPPQVAFSPQARTPFLPSPNSIVPTPGKWAPNPGKGELLCLDLCTGCPWKLRLSLRFREPEHFLKQARSQGFIRFDEQAVTRHCDALNKMHRARR
jgi:hypothetical protein